jgi:hypothetical protein
MARKRKTVDVSTLKYLSNNILTAQPDDTVYTSYAYKLGVIAILENVLHDTDNYKGFMFLDPDNSKPDTPGYVRRKYY